MLKDYIALAKPGIIAGNLFTALGAFYFAGGKTCPWQVLVSLITGLSLVIAASCAANNYHDRHIDAKMARTLKRPTAQGKISRAKVMIFTSAALTAGSAILALGANATAAIAAIAGFILYVFIYTPMKMRSHFATIIGSLPGAVPPLVGYSAASAGLPVAAWLLFLIVALWQMPHFYAIALYRMEDYSKADIPILPLSKDIKTTKIYIIAFAAAFLTSLLSLYSMGYSGLSFLACMGTVSVVWLILSLQGLKAKDNIRWAKSVFRFSLVVIVCFSASIAFRL